MKKKADVLHIIEELKIRYPDGICSLDYPKDYELLFSVRLAAQCTDERVNKVTPSLYARFPTLEDLAGADVAEVERYIHSTGFFRAKARDIVACAQKLVNEYGGRVPGTMEELTGLPGVGRKTANLVLGDIHKAPGVVVADTHCIRISGRLGLTDGTKDPGKVEGNPVFIYLDAFSRPEHFAEFLPEYQNLDELKAHYQRGGLGDVKIKKFLNAVMQAELEPIRNRRKEWEQRLPEVVEILKEGSAVAEKTAAATLANVRKAMRIDYFADNNLLK